MAEIMKARLQTPTDENGKRKDISLITDSDTVMYNDKTLSEKITEVDERLNSISDNVDKNHKSVVSISQPNYSCLWAEVLNPANKPDYLFTFYDNNDNGGLLIVDNDYTPFDPETMIKVSEIELYYQHYESMLPESGYIGQYAVKTNRNEL